MSRAGTATLNYQLTAYAQGHMNDLGSVIELAERLAPTVQVPGTAGQYKQFNDQNSFQVYNTARAMGGDPTRIEFSAADAFYNTKPQALEVTIDEEERRQAGSDNSLAQQLLDQGKIRALLNLTALSHVKKTVDAVVAAVPAEDKLGGWSAPDIDPVAQLDQVIDTLATAVGSIEGLRLTFSLSTWRTLRNHPLVIKRCQGVQVGGITLEQLNGLLAVPVDAKVYSISYNPAALGQAVAKARLMSDVVLLTYSLPNPTQYDPSAFKTFTAGPGGVQAVRSWVSPNGLYDGHFIDWSEDIKQTSTIAAKRLKIT
ncbi:MAG TPA: hypothetical protein VG167_00940 [Verrucomicrobiae bacterium]|nr:hypothetical protein [Verrucomicrobiae bacterium]